MIIKEPRSREWLGRGGQRAARLLEQSLPGLGDDELLAIGSMAVPIEFDSHPDSIVFARQLQRRDARTHTSVCGTPRSLSPEAGSEWSAAGPRDDAVAILRAIRGNDSSQGFTHMLCFFSFGASPISHGKLGIRAQARGGLTTSSAKSSLNGAHTHKKRNLAHLSLY